MELEQAEDHVRILRQKLDQIKRQDQSIDTLEKLVCSLFQITRALSAEEMRLLDKLAVLEEEHNSPRKLLGRSIHVMNDRINHAVGRTVDRALKFVHMYHDYEQAV